MSDTTEREARDAVAEYNRIEKLLEDARDARDAKVRAHYLDLAREDPTRNPSTLRMAARIDLGDSLIRVIVREERRQVERARAARPTDAPADAREDQPHG